MCTVVLLAMVDSTTRAANLLHTVFAATVSIQEQLNYTLLQDHQAIEKLAGRTILMHDHYFTTPWFSILQQELVRHSRNQQYSSQPMASLLSALCSTLCHLGKKLVTELLCWRQSEL